MKAAVAARLRPGFRLEAGMKVGLFGGSFDPPHAGHAHAARWAAQRLGLDQVIWLVSPLNPLKPVPPTGSAVARRARAASLAGRAVVSDLPARLGLAYTIDLVRTLEARFPAARLVWILGADAFAGLHRWRAWDELMRLVPMAVVARPGSGLAALASPAARRFARARLPERAAPLLALRRPPAWVFLSTPLNFASSTALRASEDRRKAKEKSPLSRTAAAQPEGARPLTPLETRVIARLEEDKAQDIVFIDVMGKSPLADALVIASGRSQRHVAAMADHLLRSLKDAGHGRARIEGLPQADWVLIDAGDVVIHLFRPEVRDYYNLEKIWSVESVQRSAVR